MLSKLEQLKDDEQREIARLIEEEINWDKIFTQSQDILNNLAQEAIKEYKSHKN